MEPTAARPEPAEPAPDVEALRALLECEADLEALERALLAAALHPATGGATAAWWLRFDERRGALLGWRAADEGYPDIPLSTAIARARRTPPTLTPATEALRGFSREVKQLAGACDVAWRTGSPACGVGAELAGAPWSDAANIAAVPLRRGPRFHGLLVLALAEKPECPPQLAWLAIAGNAALAAQERTAEARRRARQASGLAEFARLCVGPANVAEAMHALVRIAAQSLQIRHAAFFRRRDDGALAFEIAHGPAPSRELEARALQIPAAEVARASRALSGTNASDLPGPAVEGLGEMSVWALHPLVAYGRTLGVLAAWDGPERGPAAPEWERGDLDTLATLADHASLLLEHGRRLDELAAAERRREDLAARLREQDRVAAVGELAGRVVEDARQPLASMAALATRALGELPEDDPRRQYLEAVRSEAERLEALLESQQDYARLERPRLRMEALNDLAQEALRTAAEPLSRRRVRLVKKLAPDLPTLLLDAARIRRVVENILACVLEAVPVGGRMRVETRRSGTFVVLEIVHDRSRLEGDVLERLFVPFGGSLGNGAALGLGVAHQIVREHGGEIRVRSEDEWTTVFAVTLPVLDNQDRRRGDDRRSLRTERRRRAPEE
jgi:signal transduction histidine kinase